MKPIHEKSDMIKYKTARSHFILFLLIVGLVLNSCTPHIPVLPTALPIKPSSEPALDWFKIYFSDPGAKYATDFEGGPDEALAADIARARLTVDMAAYSLNLWSIRDALIHAHQRGVVVRMVMESDNMDTQEVQQIQDTGIPVVGDQHEGLMHNKFAVIDRSEVWTGSMNFTTSGTYEDNNNLVRIRSVDVANQYVKVFNEMFVDNQFGPDARIATLDPGVTIDGTKLEIYFSPEDDVQAHLLTLLQEASQSIYFLAYSFTANDLGEAIRHRAADGLTVEGVMDDDQIDSNQGTEYDLFRQAGLDVRRDGSPGLMHHKLIIIDQKIVITGSYNFSASADERNDENVAIIFSPDAARQYMQEFQKVYDQAQQP
jgi:phosphatidylserine/phosphatidylglycerophosphate/cardiolipin synthase-like enzyme